jgi:hypothetical protein
MVALMSAPGKAKHPLAHRESRQLLAFVGGLHRSGTSLVARTIASHDEVSALTGTGMPMDEGQHLQTVYPTARALGGPGRFGYAEDAHLTESSRLVCAESRAAIFDAWRPYWDTTKPVLLEKSPPNLVRMRFLQALFPRARFILVVRHPVAAALATQKWSGTSPEQLIEHWARCHRYVLDDLEWIRSLCIVRYEDLIAAPLDVRAGLAAFLSLRPAGVAPDVQLDLNERYFGRWSGWDTRFDERTEEVAAAFGYRFDSPSPCAPQLAAVADRSVTAYRRREVNGVSCRANRDCTPRASITEASGRR